MTKQVKSLLLAALGLVFLHTVNSQAPPPAGTPTGAVDPTASAAIQQDVTDTVLALLNETGYIGQPNDPNVQQVVTMLMNGVVPTELQLSEMGFIPAPVSPIQVTTPTPPPYTVPGTPTDLNTVVNPPTNTGTGSVPTVPLLPTGTQTQTGPAPTDPLLGGGGTAPAPGGTGGIMDFLPGGTGSAGGFPFPGFPMPSGTGIGTGQVTTPMPIGDPFGQNALPGTNLGPQQLPFDPNALGPKPSTGTGTPGSPLDLFGTTGTAGGTPSLPTQGILDTMNQQNQASQQQQQQRGNQMNPLMLMMMLNPEMMEGMGGENGLMTMMLLQNIMSRRQGGSNSYQQQSTAPAAPSFPMPPANTGAGMYPAPGAGSGGGLMDILNTLPPGGPGGMPMPGMMDPMNPTGGASSPMDLMNMLNPMGAAPAPTGANPMDFMSMLAPPGGAGGMAPMPGSPTGGGAMDFMSLLGGTGGGAGPLAALG